MDQLHCFERLSNLFCSSSGTVNFTTLLAGSGSALKKQPNPDLQKMKADHQPCNLGLEQFKFLLLWKFRKSTKIYVFLSVLLGKSSRRSPSPRPSGSRSWASSASSSSSSTSPSTTSSSGSNQEVRLPHHGKRLYK